jgi:hypothetical protein
MSIWWTWVMQLFISQTPYQTPVCGSFMLNSNSPFGDYHCPVTHQQHQRIVFHFKEVQVHCLQMATHSYVPQLDTFSRGCYLFCVRWHVARALTLNSRMIPFWEPCFYILPLKQNTSSCTLDKRSWISWPPCPNFFFHFWDPLGYDGHFHPPPKAILYGIWGSLLSMKFFCTKVSAFMDPAPVSSF